MILAGVGLLLNGAFAKAAPSAPPSSTTLRVALPVDVDHVDPALAYALSSWNMEYATCAKLLNYPDRPAPAGSRLVPEVAAGFPRISRDGKTYTFTVRRGFRFSDGSRVTARSFAAAINRALQPELRSPAVSFVDDVVGAEEVLAGRAATATGVEVRRNRLIVGLVAVAPDFLARIAMPFFCAIPPRMPVVAGEIGAPVPSAGPYYVAEWTRKRVLVLKPNRFYRGTRPHRPGRIVYTIGGSPETAVLQVEKGEVDWIGGLEFPVTAAGRLASKYGVNRGRFFVHPGLNFLYLALNTTRPLFQSASMRRAVNFAIDRGAMTGQLGYLGGKPTDQYLPSGMPGFRNAHIYPLGRPDIRTARRLARGRKGKAVVYASSGFLNGDAIALIVQRDLREIGLEAEIKLFDRRTLWAKLGNRGEPFDIAVTGWNADYADPYDFLNVLLDGREIRDANNLNFSYFNSPLYNRKLVAASRLSGASRYRAYGKLDAELAQHAAPLAAFANATLRDFISARAGCFTYHPIYGPDLGALCFK
jgi:peptide/nickel transport system substrate-binding protein